MTEIKIKGGMFDSDEIVEYKDGIAIGNKAVDSEFMAMMVSSLYSNGIAIGNGRDDMFEVTGSVGMNVCVKSGIAWVNGRMAYNPEDSELGLMRGKDYVICLRLDVYNGEFNIICGEESEENYPVRENDVYDLVLARVSVPSRATSSQDFIIEDTRFDSDLCGVVSSASESVNSVHYADMAGRLANGMRGEDILPLSGGSMTGRLKAKSENYSGACVRNISYGTQLPENMNEGDIFILIV